jgi:hypothetical protein
MPDIYKFKNTSTELTNMTIESLVIMLRNREDPNFDSGIGDRLSWLKILESFPIPFTKSARIDS